jgi:hypothetical protein
MGARKRRTGKQGARKGTTPSANAQGRPLSLAQQNQTHAQRVGGPTGPIGNPSNPASAAEPVEPPGNPPQPEGPSVTEATPIIGADEANRAAEEHGNA